MLISLLLMLDYYRWKSINVYFYEQLNIWDHVISEETIEKIAKCEEDIEGNYMQWSTGYILSGVDTKHLPLDTFCQNNYLTTYMWFPRLTYTQSFYICEALGGHLPLPKQRYQYGSLQYMSTGVYE